MRSDIAWSKRWGEFGRIRKFMWTYFQVRPNSPESFHQVILYFFCIVFIRSILYFFYKIRLGKMLGNVTCNCVCIAWYEYGTVESQRVWFFSQTIGLQLKPNLRSHNKMLVAIYVPFYIQLPFHSKLLFFCFVIRTNMN